MKVWVNGQQREIGEHASIAALVALLGRDPSAPGVAVAVNGAVVPRREWEQHLLADGDRVEVLAAAQGG